MPECMYSNGHTLRPQIVFQLFFLHLERVLSRSISVLSVGLEQQPTRVRTHLIATHIFQHVF